MNSQLSQAILADQAWEVLRPLISTASRRGRAAIGGPLILGPILYVVVARRQRRKVFANFVHCKNVYRVLWEGRKPGSDRQSMPNCGRWCGSRLANSLRRWLWIVSRLRPVP